MHNEIQTYMRLQVNYIGYAFIILVSGDYHSGRHSPCVGGLYSTERAHIAE